MKQVRAEKIVMKPERLLRFEIWDVIAAVLAFGGIFLAIVSATEGGAASYLAVLPGIAVIAVRVSFGKYKLVRILTPVFCGVWSIIFIFVNLGGFAGSAVGFLNRAISVSNANMHYGFPSIRTGLAQSGATDFFFASTVSVWLAYGSVFAAKIGGVMPLVALALFAALLILGLFPAPYTLVVLFLGILGKYISGYGTDAHTALSLVVSMAFVFILSSVGLFYGGSALMRNVKSSIGATTQTVFYGKDGLPQGRLKNAAGMNGEGERLQVTLNGATPTFYLRGFVGTELEGNAWKETDKNAYVSEKYQGIIDYLSQEGIPNTQYANYLALGGTNERYELTVENRGANAKYAYTPYAMAEAPSGYSSYYDLGLRRSIFSPSSYTVRVATADVSSEGVVQAGWLTGGQNQNAQMREYLSYEGDYRSFVYENYSGISEELKSALLEKLGDAGAQPTVNSVTRLIRTWLESNYIYVTTPDSYEGDFLDAFLNRDILSANPAYFASAGVYAFRAYGFAARYAEGYLVRGSGGDGQTELSVTGENEHAWVEVYFDGIGWLPIEITPTIYTLLDPDRPPPGSSEGPGGDEDPDNTDPPDDNKNPDDDENPNDDNNDKKDDDSDKQELPPVFEGADKTLPALKVLIPILATLLGVVLIAFGVFLRREFKLAKKHKRLRAVGELYGRTAYDILLEECKPIGGFEKAELEKRGVAAIDTDRFIQLVERTVYGGFELNQNERRAAESYLAKVGAAVTASGSKAFALRCKYWDCLGL